MAITPDDCVVRVEDLIVGTKDAVDMFGRHDLVPRYAPYWENFCRHTDEVKSKIKWDGSSNNPWDRAFDDELAKHGATFKRTKKYRDNYIKFKSHKHLTAFILRWS